MSNRFLGILIIIGFIGVGYLYYNLIYIPKQKIKIHEESESRKEMLEKYKEPELVIQNIKKSEEIDIERIKQKNKSYKALELSNSLNIYFIKKGNKLELYLEKEKIGVFDLVYKQYLRVDLILGTNKDLFIEVGSNKYYYNYDTNIISSINLNIDVEYVKKGIEKKLIFVTLKGSFIYNIYNKNLKYFSYFNDFVYFNEGYIGLVKSTDILRLTNLGFKTNKNIIVYYNSLTKEKIILYSTHLDIKKIYLSNNKIYLVTDDGELFELENI